MQQSPQSAFGDVARRRAVTVLFFIAALVLSALIIMLAERGRVLDRQRHAAQLAVQYTHALRQEVDRTLSATYAIAAVVRQGRGKVDDFRKLAGEMLPLYPGVSSFQLAPGGVVSEVVDAGGRGRALRRDELDFVRDARVASAAGALKHAALSEPLALSQGEIAVVGRMPVFLGDAQGEGGFWGYAAAVMRVADLARAARLDRVSEAGFRYELARVDPAGGTRQVFARTGGVALAQPVVQSFDVQDGRWEFAVEPDSGWSNDQVLFAEALMALLAASMVSLLGRSLFERPQILRREVERRTAELAAQKRTLEDEVTVREYRERQIGHLNRLYAMLSETNHVVVKNGAADELYREVCRIATETGGFRSASIHLLQDEGRRMRVVAQYGGDWCPVGAPLISDEVQEVVDGELNIVEGVCMRVRSAPERNLSAWFLVPERDPAHACLLLPLRRGGRTTSLIYLETGDDLLLDDLGRDLVAKIAAAINFAMEATEHQARRREAEEALRELNETLERRAEERTAEMRRAYAELESFAYSVSHDLRSPLRAINGYAHLLHKSERAALSEEGGAMLDRIVFNSVRMGQLIDDILEFSRVARAGMSRQETDMKAMARAVAAELGETYRQTEFDIGALDAAAGDPVMLRQVLVNLLGNACKFSAKARHPRVQMGMVGTEHGRAYFVRDNGAGFDMNYAGKLFGVFQRLHQAADFSGTGVGLAIVKRIVERHGGRVWAEGEPQRGACFYFTLDSGAPRRS